MKHKDFIRILLFVHKLWWIIPKLDLELLLIGIIEAKHLTKRK